jgi:hypothetical protein
MHSAAGEFLTSGEWMDDVLLLWLPSGQSALKQADGSSYVGSVRDGKRHGHGKQTDSNGDVYSGEWAHGVRAGYGEFRETDGAVYKGQYLNDRRHGLGFYRWADEAPESSIFSGWFTQQPAAAAAAGSIGRIFEGEFASGKLSGLGAEWNTEGLLVKCGRWEAGKLVESRAIPIAKLPVKQRLSAQG